MAVGCLSDVADGVMGGMAQRLAFEVLQGFAAGSPQGILSLPCPDLKSIPTHNGHVDLECVTNCLGCF